MGIRHNYAINGKTFVLFNSGAGVTACDWRTHLTSCSKGYGFFASLSRVDFLVKQCVACPPNEVVVGFCSLTG